MPGTTGDHCITTRFEFLNAGEVGNSNSGMDMARQILFKQPIRVLWTTQRLCQMAASTWLQAAQPQAAAVSSANTCTAAEPFSAALSADGPVSHL